MAYLSPISRPKCADCRTAFATEELRDWRNDRIRALCSKCAPRALRSMEASEKSLMRAAAEREAGA